MATSGSSLKELFQDHQDAIQEVLERTQVYVNSSGDESLVQAAADFPLDEFCVLKFLLSATRKGSKFKDVAYERLLETLKFRKAYEHLMRKARDDKELYYTMPSAIGGILGSELVVITYMGREDINEVMDRYGSVESIVERGYCGGEQIRLMLDKHSRETGKLCKLLNLVDLQGFNFARGPNTKMMKAMSILTSAHEIHIPQMTGRIVLLRPPTFIRAIITFSRPFLSKQWVEKLVICKGSSRMEVLNINACPFMSRFNNGDRAIPKDLGGALACPKTVIDL